MLDLAMDATLPRMPVLFVSHGAPTFALEPGEAGAALQRLGQRWSDPPPRAVLVISPHWTSAETLRVSASARPATLHDYHGFPAALYQLDYPAPGAPELASSVVTLLQRAGMAAEADPRRGLDHGVWVPLRYLFPQADVPVLQLSLPWPAQSAQAYALGQALAPLREQGVLIVGSGSLTHNLGHFRGGDTLLPYVRPFVAWVQAVITRGDHVALQHYRTLAPGAALAHPEEDHWLPLLVAAGAAGVEAAVQPIDGGVRYGMLSMDSFVFRDPRDPSCTASA